MRADVSANAVIDVHSLTPTACVSCFKLHDRGQPLKLGTLYGWLSLQVMQTKHLWRVMRQRRRSMPVRRMEVAL